MTGAGRGGVGGLTDAPLSRRVPSPPPHTHTTPQSPGLNTESPFSEAQQTDRPASLYAATKKSNELRLLRLRRNHPPRARPPALLLSPPSDPPPPSHTRHPRNVPRRLLAHTYAHLHGLSVTGLRYFTVYGPWGRPDSCAAGGGASHSVRSCLILN